MPLKRNIFVLYISLFLSSLTAQSILCNDDNNIDPIHVRLIVSCLIENRKQDIDQIQYSPAERSIAETTAQQLRTTSHPKLLTLADFVPCEIHDTQAPVIGALGLALKAMWSSQRY